MQYFKRVLACLAICLGVALAVPTQAALAVCAAPPPAVATAPAFSGGEPSQAMQFMYHNAWEYLRSSFYNPSAIDWTALEHAYDDKLASIADVHLALKLLTATIGDKWTYYTSPADVMQAALIRNQGELPAGLELWKYGSRYTIDVINYKSPAYGTALRERDTVRCVAAVEIANLSKQQVDALLRGRAGSKITVVAVSKDDGHEYSVDLTVAATPPEEVEGRLLPGGIIYLRLPTFASEVYLAEFVHKFEELQRQAGGNVKGLVLDLRNNRGGDITVAAKLVSLLLPNDSMTIVKSLVRTGPGLKQTDIHVVPLSALKIGGAAVDPATAAVLKQIPLAVLSNGSSASASEITLGALKDNKRGTIFGVTSFGKGVGFKVSPGPVGGVIAVTGMTYLTPGDYDVNGRGIDPDVPVEQPSNGTDAQLDEATKVLSSN